ncbi:H-NS histone family protein [Vibrio aestuarianus subsp. cardii]|uniref:H-NS family histone-like protein n=1 Tax=Vibrio aestuarianus TaxID=28171 RepID=UPI0015586FBE|nr:H-NS family nucleoid-associated regulatory protein [Vibrio aestuarianus]NGZ66593.1 H-NS histone family protein [Vibrio aestuarianus subsp. cardii]
MDNNLKNTLLNIKNFRVAVKDFSVDELLETKEKLARLIDEAKAKAEAKKKEQEEQQRVLNEAAAILKASGLSIDMLGEHIKQSKPQKAKRPNKYQYVDENGKDRRWTGQGRTPKAIQDKLDQGAKLEDFLIQPEQ